MLTLHAVPDAWEPLATAASSTSVITRLSTGRCEALLSPSELSQLDIYLFFNPTGLLTNLLIK